MPILPLVLFLCTAILGFASTHTSQIRVDQFGYLPEAAKVAVIADPVNGWDSGVSYTPGSILELRRVNDGATVFTAAPVAWNGGAVHSQSGDRAWWFDFSSVAEAGEYRIHDPENGTHSDRFFIGEDVYHEVLRHAVRVFFYQRSGFAKEEPYADARWADGASHPQDASSRPIWDPTNAALERDLSGGWFDAGDYNKYSEWTARVIMELLLAWRHNPAVFTDDFGIPESGNGIPDLLDEVKWGMDWLLRMQEIDGAVLGKVSVSQHQTASPPSADTAPRYYGPVSTEATAAAAAAFALGATIFAEVGLGDYADTLESAALAAWDWAVENPAVPFDNSGFLSASPARNSYQTLMNKLKAAVMLFERTGNPIFRDFADDHLETVQPIAWWYFYGFEADIQKALFHYAELPGATPASIDLIRERFGSSINSEEFLQAWQNETDPYRAFLKDADYVWGSNRVKAQVGFLFEKARRLGLNSESHPQYRSAAWAYLHYLHGVNPMGLVYLSNMYEAGATRSANEMYHHWFRDGSIWDNALFSPRGPAPGFVVGGPNVAYAGSIDLIRQQPPQKAYLDWNGLWPENSWEITEPAIYYQSAYIHLLSAILVPYSPDPYSVWASRYQIQGGLEGSTDSFSNLLRYALNEPTASPQTQLAKSPSQTLDINSIAISFFRVNDPRITYHLWSSSDLIDWGDSPFWSGSGPWPENASDDFGSLLLPATGETTFFRLEVTHSMNPQ